MSNPNEQDLAVAWRELAVRSKPASFVYIPASLGVLCLTPHFASRAGLSVAAFLYFLGLTVFRFRSSSRLAKATSLSWDNKRQFDLSVRLAGLSWGILSASAVSYCDGWQRWFALVLTASIAAGGLSALTPDFSLFFSFQSFLLLPPMFALILSGGVNALLAGCVLLCLGGLLCAMGWVTSRKYWQDIAHRRFQMEELASARERLELVVAGSNLGTFDWLPQVGEIYLDAKLADILGFSPEKFDPFRGPLAELVHPDDAPSVARSLGELLRSTDTEVCELEIRFLTASVEVRWFEFRGRVVQRDVSGQATRIAGTYEHITARKVAQDALEDMKVKVEQSEKLQTLGVLAGGVAHDFNNLLMAIHGNLELVALDMCPNGEAASSLECARKATMDAASLCDQLLAYAGKGKFSITSFDLSDVVGGMAQLLRVTIGKNHILKLDLETGLPPVEGDLSQIRQVVMNLITNASEAMEGCGGDEIWVRTYHQASDEYPLGLVCLEIRDQGCGMDAETQRRIFDPFFTTKFTGRGLGLASAIGIVRTHHGLMEVDSMEGEGTTFRMLLPAGVSRVADAQAPEKANSEPLVRRPMKILVVDDEASVRRITKSILAKGGHEVLLAEDGLRALEILEKQAEDIAVVLLDLTMPRKDGYQTLVEIRERWPHLPVLLASGYSADEVLQRAQAKVQGFLKKPFSKKQLLEEIGRLQPV